MKYTIRTVLVDKPNSQGKKPIKIRISIKGKVMYHSTGVRITDEEWNDKKEQVRGNEEYNTIIRNEHSKVLQGIIAVQDNLSLHRLKTVLTKGISKDFYSYCENLIDELRQKHKINTIKKYRTELKKLKAFSPQLHFSDINHSWLRKYEGYLSSLGLAQNSVAKSWEVMEFFINSALKDEIISRNPCLGYDKPKRIQVRKKFLLWEEVEKIEALLDKPYIKGNTRTVIKFFLLGCYTGLRVSDWKQYSPAFIEGDMFVLRATKNGKIISFGVHERLKRLIGLIGEERLTMTDQQINKHLKGIGELAGIKKSLSTHYARRSFAVRCAELGMNRSVTADLIGVNDKTIHAYYSLTKRAVDSEMKKWDA